MEMGDDFDDMGDDFVVDDDGAGYAHPLENERKFTKYEERQKRKAQEKIRHRGMWLHIRLY